MYDHNQTLVPESFLALYAKHGRPLLERDEMESRHEQAELVAQQIARVLEQVPADDETAQQQALATVTEGLLADLPNERASEAGWTAARAAEICGWASGAGDAAGSPHA